MVSVVEAVNSTLAASPRADAAAHVGAQVVNGVVARIIEGMSVWTVLLTLLLGAVLYDQCEYHLNFRSLCGVC
jgi:C-22 sterol desaturase